MRSTSILQRHTKTKPHIPFRNIYVPFYIAHKKSTIHTFAKGNEQSVHQPKKQRLYFTEQRWDADVIPLFSSSSSSSSCFCYSYRHHLVHRISFLLLIEHTQNIPSRSISKKNPPPPLLPHCTQTRRFSESTIPCQA